VSADRPGFVHLSVHTEYSLVDSTVRIPALIENVARAGMPAVALTDQSNLFAMVKFYRNALRSGVKPLIGVDAWIADPEQPAKPSRLLLMCQNETGYQPDPAGHTQLHRRSAQRKIRFRQGLARRGHRGSDRAVGGA
jgi:DNA polymerase III alpha subunit